MAVERVFRLKPGVAFAILGGERITSRSRLKGAKWAEFSHALEEVLELSPEEASGRTAAEVGGRVLDAVENDVMERGRGGEVVPTFVEQAREGLGKTKAFVEKKGIAVPADSPTAEEIAPSIHEGVEEMLEVAKAEAVQKQQLAKQGAVNKAATVKTSKTAGKKKADAVPAPKKGQSKSKSKSKTKTKK